MTVQFSNPSLNTLMSYTDRPAQHSMKSKTPTVSMVVKSETKDDGDMTQWTGSKAKWYITLRIYLDSNTVNIIWTQVKKKIFELNIQMKHFIF